MTPLDSYFTVSFFTLGLIFGSFYNVVALRVPVKKSIIRPPSHCPNCQRRLNALDLTPVIGYLWRRGKCAGCSERIASYYPLAEMTTGVLFVLSYTVHKSNLPELFVSLTLVSLCVIVSVSDIVYQRIPNVVLLFFLPTLIIFRLLSHPEAWISSMIGGVTGFLLLFLIAVIKPGAMGMGDVKLLGLLGFVVGGQGLIVTLFLASLIGLLVAVVLMLAGKVKWKGSIPFGPSLCAGAIAAYFWGNTILEAYLSYIGQV
jgi:leader peptidase (prepilin peptidase)/N-methyltransferase